MIANNELVEWEKVHGHCYGTPLKPVLETQKTTSLLIFDVDVNGGLSIKKRFPETILFFIRPPDHSILKERLTKRHTDSPEEIERRMKRIPEEEEKSKHYDHIVTNESIEKTVEEICSIIRDFQNKK